MVKNSNSQECDHSGYKLSCLAPDVGYSDNLVQIFVGCDDDDSFYEGTGKSGRVQLGIELVDGQMANIDFEDLLRFARTYCNGIYERVLMEVTPNA